MKSAAVLIAIGLLAAACASTQIVPTPARSASPPPSGPAFSGGAGEDVRTALQPLPSAGALDPGRYAFDNPYTDRDLTHTGTATMAAPATAESSLRYRQDGP